MRQVSSLITLTKKAIDVFGSIGLDSYNIRMEFCDLPEFISAAEKKYFGFLFYKVSKKAGNSCG